ncbi:MAG TPA: alpha/beta fold hydrolase [Nocardioidaceae bacterium]|nr:alpha/beta fold hydrolase [Nocardioidaceae bacterium]
MGIDIRYLRTGAGERLLLIHGIGHRRQAWDPVIPLLAEEHEVIAVDLPGFGESPGLPEDMTYDMPTTITNFGAFIDDLGIETPHIAGNSLGGAIALELGAAGLARSVTTLSPAGFWTAAERRYAVALLSSLRMSTRIPESMLRRIAANPRLRRESVRTIYSRPDRIDEVRFLGDAMAMRDSVAFKPTAAAGKAYHCRAVPSVPTTIAWGDRDRVLFPRQADIARRRLPNAVHISLPGCGHVPMGDNPELIAEVILRASAEARSDAA